MTRASVEGKSGLTFPQHPAEQLRWLRLHRLIGVSELLTRRGMIPADVGGLARELARQRPSVGAAQLAEERRVFSGLVSSGIPALALKGVRFAWTIYEHPEQRPRTDIDVLVHSEAVAKARAALTALGYRPLNPVAGGTPIEQEAWIHESSGELGMVDLHWKLRNHPCLRNRLTFDEQWATAIALPDLCEGAYGQSAVHTLLNASMHWFDSIYAERNPLVWLLDKDLLWREMSVVERNTACELACERGLSGLLAESLRMARAAFDTPVEDDQIEELARASHGRTPTRLIAVRDRPTKAFLFALACENGYRNRTRRIWRWLFPPSEHMRKRFPDGSRLGLTGLYWRRVRRRIQRIRRSRRAKEEF